MIAPEPRALAAALLMPTAEKVRDTSTSLRSAQDDKQEDASRRARRGLSFGITADYGVGDGEGCC